MTDPDEYFIPDDGDPWQQQLQELEQQEADASALFSKNASEVSATTDAVGTFSQQRGGEPQPAGDPLKKP